MVFSLSKNFNKNKLIVDASAKIAALSKFDSSLKNQATEDKNIPSKSSENIRKDEFLLELPEDEVINRRVDKFSPAMPNEPKDSPLSLAFSSPKNEQKDKNPEDELELVFNPNSFDKVSEDVSWEENSSLEDENASKVPELKVLNFEPNISSTGAFTGIELEAAGEATKSEDEYDPYNFEERFGAKIESALSSGTVIEGNFKFDKPVQIDGTLVGEVSSTSAIIVGSSAVIEANISAPSLIVLGRVRGDVRAEELIEIADGASLEGNIITSRLCIDDGACFQGKCEMNLGSWVSEGSDELEPEAEGVEEFEEEITYVKASEA